MSDPKYKLGSEWRTRGGWKATVVWHTGIGIIVIHHNSGDNAYSHMDSGKAIGVSASCDLLTPWTESPRLPEGVAWPKWAKAAARDANGLWYWYDMVPAINEGNIWDTGVFFNMMHPTEVPSFTGDWRDSLIVRPEPMSEQELNTEAARIIAATKNVREAVRKEES